MDGENVLVAVQHRQNSSIAECEGVTKDSKGFMVIAKWVQKLEGASCWKALAASHV